MHFTGTHVAAASLVLWIGWATAVSAETLARFEATVTQVSQIPDPTLSDYRDCLSVIKVAPEVNSQGPAEVLLVLEAFRDRVLTPSASLQPGDQIRVRAKPYDDMPDSYQSLQTVDEIEDYELDIWAATKIQRIDQFSQAAAEFPDQTESAASVLRPMIATEAERLARHDRIRSDLEDLARRLEPHGTWRAWFESLAPVRDELREKLAASSTDYLHRDHYMLADVEHSLCETAEDESPEYQQKLITFLNLKREFDRAGTDLILAPIPMRDLVYAEHFVEDVPEDGVLQPYRLKELQDLLELDIEVVDLVPAFREATRRGEVLFHYNTMDGHVSGAGAALAGTIIAERLQRYEFATSPAAWEVQPISYRPIHKTLFDPDQQFDAFRVLETASGECPPPDDSSELLVIGDSMLTAPSDASGCSVGIHVAKNAGIPAAFFKKAGEAPGMARHLARIGDAKAFFSSRKVCVFVYSSYYGARPEKQWSTTPFISALVSPHPYDTLGHLFAQEPSYLRLSGTESLQRLEIQPSLPDEPVTLPHLLVPGYGVEHRVTLPPSFLEQNQDLLVHLHYMSGNYVEWPLTIRGEPAGVLAHEAGPHRGHLYFRIPAGRDEGWSGFTIPPESGNVRLKQLEARRIGYAELAARQQDRTPMALARYNSAEDYAMLDSAPPARIDGDLLVLESYPEARRLRLFGARDGWGHRLHRLVIQSAAAAPVICTIQADGITVDEITLPGFPAALDVLLPPDLELDELDLCLPANAPEVTLLSVEAWTTRPAP